MKDLYIVIPGDVSVFLWDMVNAAIGELNPLFITSNIDLPDLTNKKILFAIQLDNLGCNIELVRIFSALQNKGSHSLRGSMGAVLVHSLSHLYTKDAAQNIILWANQLGCRFQGHPMVEATKDLRNFLTWQKKLQRPLEDICKGLCHTTVKKLMEDNPKLVDKPTLLALHSSSSKTSNTLMLWNMVKKGLTGVDIKELHVENGTVLDCIGCSYKACKHYSEQKTCYYGGALVEDILPAIEKANCIMWLCPNYNDSISANLMAVINRLTALYRRKKFYDKTLFSIIVSGNSGSDSVAKQLLGALNINKGFRLPPYFYIDAIANDPGTVKEIPNIQDKTQLFAQNIISEIKA